MPKGGGFQKNEVVTSSLDPDVAKTHVETAQRRSRSNMLQRQFEIDNGLEHLTAAGLRDKGRDEEREQQQWRLGGTESGDPM